ncbi:MAG: DNA polymerase ligase N-terminal domain-containing protein [Phycisphaerae bacterium]
MPKAFVIHLHTGHGPEHHDLMLQLAGALATWRLPASPAGLGPGDALPATRLADHRLAYLDYEGPVSRGRGRVRRIDRGDCELLRADELAWEFHLAGSTCRGRFVLHRDADRPSQWTLKRLPEEG